MNKAVAIVLTAEEWERLIECSQMGKTSPDRALRATIVLMAATGMDNGRIAGRLKVSPKMVGRWRRRFAAERLAGIDRARRNCRKRQTAWAAIVAKLASPPHENGRWSERALAAALGNCSRSTVRRACDDHGLSIRRRRPQRGRKRR
jgi:transposase